MDHFTHNIIRNELRAMTAFPPPSPELWAFSPRNDRLFATSDAAFGADKSAASLNTFALGSTTGLGNGTGMGGGLGRDRSFSVTTTTGVGLTPEQWVRRGTGAIRDALAKAH